MGAMYARNSTAPALDKLQQCKAGKWHLVLFVRAGSGLQITSHSSPGGGGMAATTTILFLLVLMGGG